MIQIRKGASVSPPPKKTQTNKQSSRFAREIPSISSHLLAMVTETNDSRNSTCEQVAELQSPVCSTLLSIVILLLPRKVVLAYVRGGD